MKGKIKSLGVTFAAIAAVSAMAASAAQAGSFDVGASPAVLNGHEELAQTPTLTVKSTAGSSFNTRCATSWVEATTEGQTNLQDATATPTYGPGCTSFGVASSVRLNGCKYTLTGSGQSFQTALVDIVGCTSIAPYIEIQTAICQLRIPPQNGLSHVVGLNTIFAGDITLEATISGIKVQQIGAACPDGNGHQSTNASFAGNTFIEGWQDKGSTFVSRHSHSYSELNTGGAAVNITAT